MSTDNGSAALPARQSQLPRYYTANSARALTGHHPETIRANVPADAYAVSVKGDKQYPLWLAATLTAWAAGRRGQSGQFQSIRQHAGLRTFGAT